MFRLAPRFYFALLLLLCLGRTLLPEAWVLALHPHQHSAHQAPRSPKSRLLFSARHQHCHAEQLYNVPFVPGSIVQVPEPVRRPRYAPQRVPQAVAGACPARPTQGQRGPPPLA